MPERDIKLYGSEIRQCCFNWVKAHYGVDCQFHDLLVFDDETKDMRQVIDSQVQYLFRIKEDD